MAKNKLFCCCYT